MTGNAIEVRGLAKTYAASGKSPAKEALKGIDLDIPRGSVFGLLGPNGAGKSTLINILAGLVVKSAGQVSIWGFDQDRNPRQSRAAIGVMPQELNLDPFFTPRAALEVQAGLYGLAVIGVLASVVGLFYYLRIVKVMWFDDQPSSEFVPMATELRVVLGAAALFIFPVYLLVGGPIFAAAEAAARTFF